MVKFYFKGKLIGSSSRLTANEFHRFAEYQDDVLNLPIECIVVVELPNEQSADRFNLILQNSIGQDIFKKCKHKNSMYANQAAYVHISDSNI